MTQLCGNINSSNGCSKILLVVCDLRNTNFLKMKLEAQLIGVDSEPIYEFCSNRSFYLKASGLSLGEFSRLK